MKRRLRRRVAVTIATAAVIGGIAGTLAAHGQTVVTSFEVTASAEGVRVGVAAPNFVAFDQLVDIGIPVAQSTVDGLANSRAFAANPYPGDLVVSGPGLFSGLTGLPNPGNYPLHVATTHPTTPEANFSQPNFELAAKSTEQSSEALASAGGSAADSSIAAMRATAVSRRDARSGAVSAEAVSTADIANLAGGVLRIGAVRATAKVTRKPGSGPVRSSSLAIDGVSIGGQSVGFGEKGLVLAGTATPIPEDNPLAEILKQANITMRYLKPVSDADGVVSPGLAVTQRQQVPQGPNLVITYVFGRAVAHAALTGAAAAIPAIAGGGGADTALTPPVADSGNASANGADTGGGLSAPSADSVSRAIGSARAAPPALDTRGRATPTRSSKGGASTASIYLILIVGAIVGLAGGQLLRIAGVRMKWSS